MRGKQVNQYDGDWVFMKRYPSIKDAATETGVSAGNICLCCRGRMNTAKGFHWIYAYKAKYHPILIKRAKR